MTRNFEWYQIYYRCLNLNIIPILNAELLETIIQKH